MLFLISCKNPEANFFLSLTKDDTGVDFINSITENDSLNLLVNEYTYMGGGVGLADFNNDGLVDIFLTGNQVSNALYLNKGDFRFEDITISSGLVSRQWCTGVSIVDINQDGLQDIYVSVSDLNLTKKQSNLLYINHGNLTFSEEASQYGLDVIGYNTQAIFFDFDRDNDLDIFFVNHKVGGSNPNDIKKTDESPECISCDRLLRNDGPGKLKKIIYTDVTQVAGIDSPGLGLGVVAGDMNGDDWPDLYVGNDYLASDKLYLNNRDGTFKNIAPTSLGHQSYSTMGVDAADINNDGALDIISLDMQPENTERKKLMFSFLTNDRYELERRAGYDVQLMRNMLQLNSGTLPTGDPLFREVGQLAGISETDWSWSVLAADFDNDGFKDIHITNGMGRDLIHADFVQYRSDSRNQSWQMPIDRQRVLQQKLAEMGPVKLKNYLFSNADSLRFNNISQQAGIIENTISNGAAYGDLDNDGDLDLVINNINSVATLMRNEADHKSQGNHFITINLKGKQGNIDGIGAKVFVYTRSKKQLVDQNPVRGYLSCVDKKMIVGVGKEMVDSILVTWPDGSREKIGQVRWDSVLTIDQRNVTFTSQDSNGLMHPIFSSLRNGMNISFRHVDPFFNDFAFQRFLPRKYSNEGPCIATADVNGDHLTDFFVGGSFTQRGELFVQQRNGSFKATAIGAEPKYEEDTGAAFFDIDKDNDLDLFVASGSNEFEAGSSYYVPRLYLNDGKGNFHIDKERIAPNIQTSGNVVSVNDFDHDGDEDVFLGGRVSPLHYPESPRSFLLRNDNGKLVDVTRTVGPEIESSGMITGGVWIDYDDDGDDDLMVSGEWMTIIIFQNDNGKFKRVQRDEFSDLQGLWRCMSKGDIDNDGDIDVLVGNVGLNHAREMSKSKPWILYHHDFDLNGSKEIILCQSFKDKDGNNVLRPSISRNQLSEVLSSIKKKFPNNSSYSTATLDDIFGDNHLTSVGFLKAIEPRSGYLENLGAGKFRFVPFPLEAQFAPINSILCTDLNNDQNIDLILAGNEFQNDVIQGRDDASFGLVLMGIKDGGYEVLPYSRSGLHLKGDIKSMAFMDVVASHQKVLIGAANQDSLQVFVCNK
ncbi:MAG TPA: VCBS repeat-containing protein [Cyclobacteriaceae bacterium]